MHDGRTLGRSRPMRVKAQTRSIFLSYLKTVPRAACLQLVGRLFVAECLELSFATSIPFRPRGSLIALDSTWSSRRATMNEKHRLTIGLLKLFDLALVVFAFVLTAFLIVKADHTVSLVQFLSVRTRVVNFAI